MSRLIPAYLGWRHFAMPDATMKKMDAIMMPSAAALKTESQWTSMRSLLAPARNRAHTFSAMAEMMQIKTAVLTVLMAIIRNMTCLSTL